jgi:DNA modification methylase
MIDFPGDIIRQHERLGFKYVARYAIWKDPFVVYLRTLQKSLRHRTCTEDSSKCSVAAADYLLVFRREGENKEPIAHPTGLLHYAGSRNPPADILKFRGWTGNQTENRYSQWVWRQYASAFWDDVRLERVLPHRDAKDPEDERHVHPLQLDVIDRAVTLWSNPGDVVFTPFMGVGSEAYGAVTLGRRAVGVELKTIYYKQAALNLAAAAEGDKRSSDERQIGLFGDAPRPSATGWSDTEDGEEVSA